MWIEAEEDLHRETFGHFCAMAEERGHVITALAVEPFTEVASWIAPADAYLLRTTGYIDQEELTQPFVGGLDAGKRVLWLGRNAEKVNRWTIERFSFGLLTEQHFNLARFASRDWAERRDLDRVIARSANPLHGIDLLRGVERVALSRPNVVRVLDPAESLLEVPVRDLVDQRDLPVQALAINERADSCVAAAWGAPGSHSPQAVLVGDGDWLVDGMLNKEQADNKAFAANLIEWLAGAPSHRAVAEHARSLTNEIELLVWEVALNCLRRAHGDQWPSVLSAERRERIRRLRPGTPWERALDPGDKVAILRSEPDLARMYAPGGISRTRAKSLWATFLDVRVRVAHVEHLAGSPVSQSEVESLKRLRDDLADERRRWYRSIDDGPER
jgi:hypothetical protein